MADLRSLPSVDRVLAEPSLAGAIARHGRAAVRDAARRALDAARARIRAGEAFVFDPAQVLAALSPPRRLRRVLNATGVVLHTNLGRAPLAAEAIAAVTDAARGYSTLELDLSTGKRGSRHDHARAALIELFGAEDAIAVNNCAAAVLLALAAWARGKEVIVARSELVEIGGGFRVPDVMRASGAKLVEVGTTNRVHLEDYRRALGPKTGAILKVHRSNFALVGFVKDVEIPELAPLAREANVPLIADLGSGLVAPLRNRENEPRPAEAIAEGADLVLFSGDKLLGGPQAGIAAGKAERVARLRRHPLARAVRIDKLGLAALEATLELHLRRRAAEIPALAMIEASPEAVRAHAGRIAAALHARGVEVELAPHVSKVGGGCLPMASLETTLVLVAGEPAPLLQALRSGEPPMIARILRDKVAIDPRTLLFEPLDEIVTVLSRAHQRTKSLYSV